MKSSDAPFIPEPRSVWPDDQRSAAMLWFDIDGETTALGEGPALAKRRPHAEARREIAFDHCTTSACPTHASH